MKNTFTALCMLLLICSCSDPKPEGNVHITGNIKGLQSGTLYIQKIVDTALVAIDTIQIDGDAHFESHLTIDSPEMYYLFLDRGVTNSLDNNLPVFLEPGNIHIETELTQYYNKAKIKGSKNHDLYEEYKKSASRFNNQRLLLTEAKIRALKKNDVVKLDSIAKATDKVLKRKYLFATNFALNNRDHEVAPFIALTEIYDINLKYLDTIRKSLPPKIAESFYGKKLSAFYKARTSEEQ